MRKKASSYILTFINGEQIGEYSSMKEVLNKIEELTNRRPTRIDNNMLVYGVIKVTFKYNE